ncbi:hypothetical protein CMUS01_10604 [Colletotrichum musicola]|uniref:Uncharacterized protein n=1 Tax=Colletotrichum musicola TaxID=2175873 RepID=A0A8H6K2T1_9PEZI|nr:hypothetical protein CMUS01_10604 [Colletotrichum musicola]
MQGLRRRRLHRGRASAFLEFPCPSLRTKCVVEEDLQELSAAEMLASYVVITYCVSVCLSALTHAYVLTARHPITRKPARLLNARDVSTCAGHTGYFACDITLGGGCCPQGYVCERGNNCLARVENPGCAVGYFDCAADATGSCCPTGHTCGVGGLCWAPAGATIGVVTVDTLTVTRESQTVPLTIHLTTTVDSVITAQTQVSALQATTSPGTATVTQVVQITGSSGGGLTSAQVGGISGGAAALLLLVAGGVYILIRRLNVIAKFMGEHSRKAQADGSDLPNDGKGEMEAKSILPGSRVRVNETGTEIEEMSPQHGNPVSWTQQQRPPELSGGYEAHGISELEAPLNKRQA